jgi:hypothetical protein
LKRWLVRGIIFFVFLVALVFVVERNLLVTVWLTDDSNHSDSLTFKTAIRKVDGESRADLSGLNGGDWRIVCVAGGYQDAASVLHAFAPNDPATKWWKLIWPWLYAGDVPEHAIALIYVTRSSAVRVRRLIAPHGNQEHVKACAMSPNKELIWR